MRILALWVAVASVTAAAEEVDAQALFDSTAASSLSANDRKRLRQYFEQQKKQSADRFKLEEAETRKELRLQFQQKNVEALLRSLELEHKDKLQDFLRRNPDTFKNLKLSTQQESELTRRMSALTEEHKSRLDEPAQKKFLEYFNNLLIHTGKVHGENDQVTFPPRVAPLPGALGGLPTMPARFDRYQPLLDAVGQLKGTGEVCSASHLGDGLVLTAGHCFDQERHLRANAECGQVTVRWGVLADGVPSLSSTCTSVLIDELSGTRDFALMRVAPFPAAKLKPRLVPLPVIDQQVAVLGYPADSLGVQLTLRATPPCPLISATRANRPSDAEMLGYQCDTLGGQSGGPVLDATTLELVGVHNGGVERLRSPGEGLKDAFNYATIFRAPAFGEFFPAQLANAPEPRCADVAERLARVVQADGGLPAISLTEDHLQIASCGSASQRQVLGDSLRSQADGGDPVFVPWRYTLQKLQQKQQAGAKVKARANATCDGGLDCVVAVVVDSRAIDLSTESAPGGDSLSNAISVAYNCGLSHSTIGHFEYSNYAALAAGFTRDGARLIANATQDVDEYQWFNAAAHGQTPNPRKRALFAKSPTEARVDFRKWEQCQLKRARLACARPEVTLYWLGAALHGVQDLIFHKGISNAEHSYRDHMLHEGRDCAEPAGNATAHRISKGLLSGFLAGVPAACAQKLKAATGVEVTAALRVETWGHPDRTGAWLSEYFEEGEAFERLTNDTIPSSRYRLADPWWTSTSTPDSLVNELLAAPTGDPCAPY